MPAKKKSSDNVKVCDRFLCMQPYALDREPAPFAKKAARVPVLRWAAGQTRVTIDELSNPCPNLAPTTRIGHLQSCACHRRMLQVAVRCRPLSSNEKTQKCVTTVKIDTRFATRPPI